jgi:membrane-bound ClpP family serine protease
MLDRLAYSMAFTMMGVILAGIGAYFVSKHFGNIPILSRMILGNPDPLPQGPGLLNAKAGTITRTSGDDALGEGELKVGDTGKALTTLRPSGQASIMGYNVDVVSVGAMIDAGQRVKIIAIDGNRIQVDHA